MGSNNHVTLDEGADTGGPIRVRHPGTHPGDSQCEDARSFR
jgi:hypothetical protein